MKIGFFGEIEPDKQHYYQTALTGHTLDFAGHNVDDQNLPAVADYDAISVFVGCQVTSKVIDSLPNLKLIVARSTGFDNIDTNYAKQKQIVVSNVPSYGSHTVAEYTFALILNLTRNTYQGIARVKNEIKFDHSGLRGFDLVDKTLGVIGTGQIGTNVIRIAHGFGMKILAHDSFPNHELSTGLDFQYVGLEELLRGSDIITLHVPATEHTFHMISTNQFNMMKPQAILINTARGKIVDTQALYHALVSRHLGGAALDVLESETMIDDVEKQLINFPHVIVTPHMAFYTVEAESTIMKTTAENVISFAQGYPKNRVA